MCATGVGSGIAQSLALEQIGKAVELRADLFVPSGVRIRSCAGRVTRTSERWSQLDRFEGSGYRRLLKPVRRADGSHIVATIYAHAESQDQTRALYREKRPISCNRPRRT